MVAIAYRSSRIIRESFPPDGALILSRRGVDLLPTLCALAGRPLPQNVELDGRDIGDVLRRGAPSPHEEIVLFDNEDVVGIRTQDWKYVDAGYYRGFGKVKYSAMGYTELYDMRVDPSESYSVAANQPQVAQEMRARFGKAQETFAESISVRRMPQRTPTSN